MWLLDFEGHLINLNNVLTITMIKLQYEGYSIRLDCIGSTAEVDNRIFIPLEGKTEEEAKEVFNSIVYQLNTTTTKVIKL